MADRVPQGAEAFQGKLEQVVLQEDDLLGLGQDAKVGREAEEDRVLAQEPVAEGVEGADLGLDVAVGDELVDPLLHLRGGAVGEGEAEDLRRLRAFLGDQPGDAAGDDRRLPGPDPGDHEERPLAEGDRLALGVVQIGEKVARHRARV